MTSISYCIISFICMIVTCIFTHNSPLVFVELITNFLGTIFPFFDYYQLTKEDEVATAIAFLVGLIADWFLSFIESNFLSEDESEVSLTWLGNAFNVLTLSMLLTNFPATNTNQFATVIQYLLLGSFGIMSLIQFFVIEKNISVFTLFKIPFTNPFSQGFLLFILRWIAPILVCSLILIPISFIPFNFVQVILISIMVLLMFFIKYYTDRLVDTIDSNETKKLLRFLFSLSVIITAIYFRMK